MSEWTKEPWSVDVFGDAVHGDGQVICGLCETPDSTRIVACVNACKGIPTAQLPGLAEGVRRLREALIESLALNINYHETADDGQDFEEAKAVIKMAQDALAGGSDESR